jgi:hypothetical protein
MGFHGFHAFTERTITHYRFYDTTPSMGNGQRYETRYEPRGLLYIWWMTGCNYERREMEMHIHV